MVYILRRTETLSEIIRLRFFITMLAANLLYSQSLRVFPSKAVIICAVFIFELGSLICGVARNMPILIFGRAVAGLGAAGIFTGAVVILAETTTMQKRAQLMGLIGVAFVFLLSLHRDRRC